MRKMERMIEVPFAPARGRHVGVSREQAQMTPGRIWVVLTLEQQQRVFQQMVSICCHVAERSSIQQEENDEQR
jgi:hypothetical protein